MSKNTFTMVQHRTKPAEAPRTAGHEVLIWGNTGRVMPQDATQPTIPTIGGLHVRTTQGVGR